MTLRKERRRLEQRLKRTQYTQKSITMATTLVAGSTFIPALGHAAETTTVETKDSQAEIATNQSEHTSVATTESTEESTSISESTDQSETTVSSNVEDETSDTGNTQSSESSEVSSIQDTTTNESQEAATTAVPTISRALLARTAIDTTGFINQISGHATDVAAANDLYASVMMAQAILESGWGTSALTTTANNMFGIKGSYSGQSVTMNTYEDDGSGNYYLISAKFRKYPSLKESFQDNAYVLRTTSFSSGSYFYSGAWKSKTTSYTQATAWLQGRYATDTSYASKLNNLIATYNLTQYDTGSNSNNNSSNNSNSSSDNVSSNETAISKKMKTTAAMNIRQDASTSATITGSVAANTTITVTASKSGTAVNGHTTWYKISGKGWVNGAYLTEISSDTSSSNNSSSNNTNNGTAINKQMKTTAAMNIRSDASTSSTVVGSLSSGVTVTATATKTGTTINGNKNWYYVSNKGWISGAYLSEVTTNSSNNNTSNSSSSNTTINKQMKTTAAMNIRSDASTSSTVVGSLSSGATVTATATKTGAAVNGNKNWYYVSNKGWVSGAYLSEVTTNSSNNSANNNTSNSSSSNTAINKQMKTTAAMNVRSDASTSSKVVAALSKGATVTVTATKTGTAVNGNKTWYYVSGKGWVSGAYMTSVSTSSQSSSSSNASASIKEKMKTTDTLNVRSDASTSSSIAGSLSKGTTVTVTATKTGTTVNGTNKWYYVSGKGWVSGAYLSSVSSGTSTSSATSSANTTYYTVKSGDSLWALAQKNGTSISNITSWNKLSSNMIYVGQKLIVAK